MTTGSRGLHVVAPIRRELDYPDVLAMAKALGRVVMERCDGADDGVQEGEARGPRVRRLPAQPQGAHRGRAVGGARPRRRAGRDARRAGRARRPELRPRRLDAARCRRSGRRSVGGVQCGSGVAAVGGEARAAGRGAVAARCAATPQASAAAKRQRDQQDDQRRDRLQRRRRRRPSARAGGPRACRRRTRAARSSAGRPWPGSPRRRAGGPAR